MREIKIYRKKSMISAMANPLIVLDGKIVGKVKNGQTPIIMIDEESHEIFTSYNKVQGNILQIKPGNEDINLFLAPGFMSSKFILSTDLDETTVRYVEEVKPTYAPQSQTASYVCGIIISLILIILSFSLYNSEEASFSGFIFGLILAVASGVAIIMGGFWIVVVPLPYIAIWKAGCVKPHQSSSKKVVLGILSFVFPVLAIVLLFAL